MTVIVKVDAIPEGRNPVEGVDYNVLPGNAGLGDKVRISTPSGAVIFESCYTPPAAPPAPQPLVLSATAFQNAAETGLGSRARFGEVIRTMQTSVDDEVLAVYKRYDKSITFEKSKAAAMLALLRDKTIVTPQERTAILAAWPNG